MIYTQEQKATITFSDTENINVRVYIQLLDGFAICHWYATTMLSEQQVHNAKALQTTLFINFTFLLTTHLITNHNVIIITST